VSDEPMMAAADVVLPVGPCTAVIIQPEPRGVSLDGAPGSREDPRAEGR
jgi:hypothetical protein